MQASTQAMSPAAGATAARVSPQDFGRAHPISPEATALLQAARNTAFLRAQEGRLADGMQLLMDALTLEPQNHAVLSDVAALLLLAREYRHAVDYAQRALSIEPGHGPSLYALGFGLAAQGHNEQALAVLAGLLKGAALQSLASEAPELVPLVEYEHKRLKELLADEG